MRLFLDGEALPRPRDWLVCARGSWIITEVEPAGCSGWERGESPLEKKKRLFDRRGVSCLK